MAFRQHGGPRPGGYASPMAKVLVAEDEAAIADAVLYALRSEGFEAEHCLLGRDVVPKVRAGGIDVVVLDVGLPDMSGFDVCRELRRFSDVPIVFLTARADEIDRVLGLELGADDYVAKPFSPRELVARVRAGLRRARQPMRAHGGTRARSSSTTKATASATAAAARPDPLRIRLARGAAASARARS